MSLPDVLSRYSAVRAAIRAALLAQGVSVPSEAGFEDFPGYIDMIEGGEPVATEPSALTSGQWSVVPGLAPGSLDLNIIALPANGGSPITALQCRVGAGSWVGLVGTGTGVRTVTDLTEGVPVDIQVRAVNAIGNGAASDTKSATPTSSGGSGVATWLRSAATLGGIPQEGSLAVVNATGGTASDTLVMIVTGVAEDQHPVLTPPPGWTFRHTHYNKAGFGAGSPIGYAIYTAPGNTASGDWAMGTPSNSGGFEGNFGCHLWSGVNSAAPIREHISQDSEDFGTGADMPSPSATPQAGDGVMAHLYYMQSQDPFTVVPAGYTQALNEAEPGRTSTLVRSNCPAGATGLIAQGAGGAWQSRVGFTIVLGAA